MAGCGEPCGETPISSSRRSTSSTREFQALFQSTGPLSFCYGVPDPVYQDWMAMAGPTTTVTLELPDGSPSAVEVPLQVPVGGWLLQYHLEDPESPPPAALGLMFAGSRIPMSATLEEMSVMEGALLQLQHNAVQPIRLMLGTREGERPVHLWPDEPVGLAIARALRKELKCAEPLGSHYFAMPEHAEGDTEAVTPSRATKHHTVTLDKTVAEAGLAEGARLLPGLLVGDRWVPLQQIQPTMSLDPISNCGAWENFRGNWRGIVEAVDANDLEQLGALTAMGDFDPSFRPEPGCWCGSSRSYEFDPFNCEIKTHGRMCCWSFGPIFCFCYLPCYCLSYCISLWSGWRPGDTLLHYAVRRGPGATSDGTVLALLEAGYDPDAINLGCPCCCWLGSSTPRELADGSHVQLLDNLAPISAGMSWGLIQWEAQDGRRVPMQIVDGLQTPLAPISPTMGFIPVSCCPLTDGMYSAGYERADEPAQWGMLVDAVEENNLGRLKQLTATNDFDANWRPTGFWLANSGTCQSGKMSCCCISKAAQWCWYNPCCWGLPFPCGAISVLCYGWRPGDTLLHWAIRRGPGVTSDETVLALLEAGYDPDAINLGCPCCCGHCASSPRELAKGSHAELLGAVSPLSTWQEVLWQGEDRVPCTRINDELVPLTRAYTTEQNPTGQLAPRARHVGWVDEDPIGQPDDYLEWPELCRAVRRNDLPRIKQLTDRDEFAARGWLDYRPTPRWCCVDDRMRCGCPCEPFRPFNHWHVCRLVSYLLPCPPVCLVMAGHLGCVYGTLPCTGWRPGDTLLHYAVRRGPRATSDETVLALLEAGYDPDAINLGCPCCCGHCASSPRELAKGSHAALIEHITMARPLPVEEAAEPVEVQLEDPAEGEALEEGAAPEEEADDAQILAEGSPRAAQGTPEPLEVQVGVEADNEDVDFVGPTGDYDNLDEDPTQNQI